MAAPGITIGSSTPPPPPNTTLAPGGRPKFDVSGSGDQPVVTAIIRNDPFPDGDVEMGKLSIGTSDGRDFTLPSGSGSVSFQGKGSVYAGAAAYVNPGKLSAELGLQTDDGAQLGVDFGKDPTRRWIVVRWGFSLSGGASAKVALSPYGSATFGVDGSSEGLYAVVRSLPKAIHAQDAFLDTLKNWQMPRSINALLPAGTWILSEVEGELKAKLGFSAGYDFNWVRHEQLGGLSGDIGLRLQLGLNAALGVNLAGKYLMVLSCEDDPAKIRYRLYRMSKKGWDFALNVGAEADTSTGDFLPEKLDDFIKAVFGIHDAQLLRYLQAASTQEIIDAFGQDFLPLFDSDNTKAANTLSALLAKWNALPHDVASVIWSYTSNNSVLSQIASAAQTISTANQETLKNLLDEYLGKVDFHGTPVGRWLEAAAEKPLLELYTNLAAKTQLTQIAKSVLQVLDGSECQTALAMLKTKVESIVDMAKLQQAIQNNSVTGLAAWVQEQLAHFLGVDTSALTTKLGKLNSIIQLVRNKSSQFYDATRRALNNKYAFSLQYAYQASNLNTALLDIEFEATALNYLRSAVEGDFTQILSQPIAGVRVRSATLTHALNRQAHSEVNLPFYAGKADNIEQAFASERVADSENGRVQLFEAGAKDEQMQWASTNVQRYAACSFGVSGAVTGVRQYSIGSVDFGYEFRLNRPAMTRSEFTYQFKDVVGTYFPNAFGDGNNNQQHGVFSDWVADWDKYADQHPDHTPDGNGVIGNTWSSMQVRIPAEADKDWLDALLNGADEPNYKTMSLALQTAYRANIFQSYSADPGNFADISGPLTDAFLVYVSIPARNGLKLQNDGTVVSVQNNDLVWDVSDLELLKAVLFFPETISSMRSTFARINELLNGIPNLKSRAAFYTPGLADARVSTVARGNQRVNNLKWLLELERGFIYGAADAFKALRSAAGKQLGNALDSFAAAGLKLVDTFNSKVGSVFDTAHTVRYFGPILFQKAIAGMYPGKAPQVTDAILDVAVLKNKQFPQGDDLPAKENILLQQHIVALY